MNHEGSAIYSEKENFYFCERRWGYPEALNVLFESCRRSLYCRALRILARPQDAEDAVQDAMLAAFTNLHRFQGRSDFLTWVTSIVINAALNTSANPGRNRLSPGIKSTPNSRGHCSANT